VESKGGLGCRKTMENSGVLVPVTQPPKEGVEWVTDLHFTYRTMSHPGQPVKAWGPQSL
jgi:hypothetical protein